MLFISKRGVNVANVHHVCLLHPSSLQLLHNGAEFGHVVPSHRRLDSMQQKSACLITTQVTGMSGPGSRFNAPITLN